MWNGPYRRRGIRFFPHIVPIAFPLIFPLGFGILAGLFHLALTILGFLIFAALIFFIVRLAILGSPEAAWNSMKNNGKQWQTRFTAQQKQWQQQRQQQPYYQPSSSAGQPQQPYYQPSAAAGQPQQPYYQPSAAATQQTYGQGYQSEPYYRPMEQSNNFDQPQAHYPEQMPPMQ